MKSARFISFNPALNVYVDLSFFIVVRTHVTTRRPELHAERDEGVPADTERLGVHSEDAAREAFKETTGDCLFVFLARCCFLMTEKFFSHVLRAIVVWSFTKMSVLPPSERPGGGAEVVKEGNDGCRAGVCLQGESTG